MIISHPPSALHIELVWDHATTDLDFTLFLTDTATGDIDGELSLRIDSPGTSQDVVVLFDSLPGGGVLGVAPTETLMGQQ